MKSAILIIAFLMTSLSAQAASVVVRLDKVSGQLVAKDQVRITEVGVHLGASFCWGFCNPNPDKLKQIRAQVVISADGRDAAFMTSNNQMFRASNVISRFGSCSISVSVEGVTSDGTVLRGRNVILSNEDKNACGNEAAMTALVNDALSEPLVVERIARGEGEILNVLRQD